MNEKLSTMTPIETIAGWIAHAQKVRFWTSIRVTCPTEPLEGELITTIVKIMGEHGVPVEIVDLQPAPAERLDALTQRLWDPSGSNSDSKPGPTGTLLIVSGIELLAGRENDAPTYPFRSRFQFDEQFRWLFVVRDGARAALLFANHSHPLYHAAMDITPDEWRHKPLRRSYARPPA